MISKYTYKGLTWIDLELPNKSELSHIMEEYSIPPVVGEEMKNLSLQSKVDLYPNFIYLILHFPEIAHIGNRSIEKEIDFIISNNFIITIHYEPIDSLHEFSKTFEVDAILERRMDVDHAGFLFFHLIKTLYAQSRMQLNTINLLLKNVENKIFEGSEGKMVESISNINHTLLDFRQAIRFHKEVLDSLDFAAKHFFGEKFGYYTNAILSEYNKTESTLDSHKEILDDLRETNDSLLANRTKETMKILTIITFLISPIAVISNIFVINSRFLKSEDPRLYLLVLVLMLATSLLAFIYIKSKKWL